MICIVGDSAHVCVDGGRIAAPAPLAEVLDAGAAAVLPGRVCAHTHLYSGLVPLGMPAPEPPPTDFVQILERVWWRLDRALTHDTLRASARLYVAEALLSGTTAVIDHHESPVCLEGSLDVLADACEELGIRAVLCYGATERNGGREEARRGLQECRRFLYGRATDTIQGLVGLHASFTVSDDTVSEAGALCAEAGSALHVHVAEDGADVTDARTRGYPGPLERLEHLGALPPGSILAHGVHLDPAQVRHAAQLGCWLVHNPRSNEGNGVGYPTSLAHSDRVALGTDGYPADMRVEVREGGPIAERNGDAPGILKLRLSRGDGLLAERFGMPFGSLDPGSAADLVVEEDGAVRHVLVAGQVVVRDGVLVRGSLDEIRGEAERAAARLWSAMRGL